MKTLKIQTLINAPIRVCFDLSRNIELHQESMKHTCEQAIAGRTTGLIQLNESVTWKAKHFGMYFKMTNKITMLEYPYLFVDEMVKGPFKKLRHEHRFEVTKSGTLMIDIFEFEAPVGFLGKIIESLFLNSYLEKLLVKRNQLIVHLAEQIKTSRSLRV